MNKVYETTTTPKHTWYVCTYAKNQPWVCEEICAANCKMKIKIKGKGKFGNCKIYERYMLNDNDNEFFNRPSKD